MLNAKIKCKRCKIDTKLLATFDEIEGLEKIPADQTKEYLFLSRVNTIQDFLTDVIHAQNNILDFRNDIEGKMEV